MGRCQLPGSRLRGKIMLKIAKPPAGNVGGFVLYKIACELPKINSNLMQPKVEQLGSTKIETNLFLIVKPKKD